MSTQTIENLLQKAERLAVNERLLLIERLAESIRRIQRRPVTITAADVENTDATPRHFPPSRLEDVAGRLHYQGPPKTTEEMNAAVAAQFRQEWRT